jgi:hypothetical protein
MSDFPTLPNGLWALLCAVAIAVAVILHAVLPRYEYQLIQNGQAIVIYDKWTGKWQRANYNANGDADLRGVLTPF